MTDPTPLPRHLARTADGTLVAAKRKRGRPVKLPVSEPLLPDEAAYVREINRLRRQHVDADPIVRALEDRAASPVILSHAVEQLALEAAEIRYEIMKDCAAGRINLIDRKRGKVIDGYHKIALILIDAARLGLDLARKNAS